MSTRLAVTLVVAASLAFAAPAMAVNFTSSQITTPADGTFPVFNFNAPAMLHVVGTTSGGDSNADLVCFFGTDRKVLASNVTVTGGLLNADVSTAQMDTFTQSQPRPYCVLRAIPTGDATNYPPDAPSAFSGPHLGFGRMQTYTVDDGGPNTDLVNDFFIGSGQSQGYMDYFSLGFCGLNNSVVFDPITLAQSSPLFNCNGWLYNGNGCRSANANCSAASRSDLLVDGMHAYAPGNAYSLWDIDATHKSGWNSGLPPLTFTKSIDPLNGDVHISETDEIARCSPNGTAYHASRDDAAWPTDCASFVPAGVRVDRTGLGDHNGRRATFTDVWTSTDGSGHAVDVIYDQEFSGQAGNPPFVDYLWDADPFVAAPKDQTVPGPTSAGPATVLVDGNGANADVFTFPQGAVTFSMAPADVHWYGGDGNNHLYGSFRFTFTVPANGSVIVRHGYVDSSSKDEVAGQANLDRDRLSSPQVAITGPADGSTVDNASVVATGTASDPGGAVTSLTVNGEAVAPGADGAWSKALTLAQGENTITAVVADAAGNNSAATSKVTFTPKRPTVVPPPVTTVADGIAPRLGLTIARIKLAALVARGLPVKVSCSEACTFVITLLVDRKTAKRVGLAAAKSVKVGSAKGSLPAKGSKTVRAKLTKKAKKKLKNAKQVTLTVAVTAKDKPGNTSKKSKSVVIKRR